MHVPKGLRNLFVAVALATLALPLASTTPLATPAHAQTTFPLAPASVSNTAGDCASATDANCFVSADPALAFNVLGASHTVTLTCGAAVSSLSGGTANTTAGFVPGCYDVTASVTDEVGGASPAFTYARCGNSAVTLTGSTVNCAGYTSPLCPVGQTSTAGGTCNAADPNAPQSSQLAVTINPGANHSYLFSFSGYTLLNGACTTVITSGDNAGMCSTAANPTGLVSACPPDFNYVPGPFELTVSTGVPPFQGQVAAPDGVCQFTLNTEKKYVEITSLQLTATNATGGPCAAIPGPATLVFAEGLKTFFGPSCFVSATATGVVVLKSNVTCANEPANGQPFPGIANATYQCSGDTLSAVITGINNSTLNSGGVPIVFNQTGSAGFFNFRSTLGANNNQLCSGIGGSVASVTGGTPVAICAIGPGAGTVQACVTGFLPDSQPPICSNTLSFSFNLPSVARVVPYVRWAGEKQVLTKCFGGVGNLSGALVEFTLEGAGASAQATLFPATLGAAGTLGGGNPLSAPSQSTVITQTDADGCATVIVYAADAGVVNVDASIYAPGPNDFNGTSPAGNIPLINEHAFEIFYLKFDHINLEDISMTTVKSSTLTNSQLSTTSLSGLGFTTASASLPATFQLPSAPGANPPSAGGVYPIPLCGTDYVRAMVHGYFQMPSDPSGRPATTVSIPNAPNGASSSYVLPAGRWVLPEDWPVLATFAGFTSSGAPNDTTASSVYAWDLNSGYVFNPGSERADLCAGPTTIPQASGFGPIPNGIGAGNVSYGPCYGQDVKGQSYSTASAGPNCSSGVTTGIGPFDITQACTNPFPLTYSPSGSSVLVNGSIGTFDVAPLSTNSTYLPNGTLNEWDAPMPPANVDFAITGGPGTLGEVNKTGLYSIPTVDATGAANGGIYPDPFYSEAIPASPLIPAITNNGGYLWNTFGAGGSAVLGTTTSAATEAGQYPLVTNPYAAGTSCPPGFGYRPAADVQPCALITTPADTSSKAECDALGATFGSTTSPLAYCRVPANVSRNPVEPGLNTTNFGAGCPATVGTTSISFPSSSTSVRVLNAARFVPGMHVFVYDARTGTDVLFDLIVGSVSGNTINFTTSSTFGIGTCLLAGNYVFVSQDFAIASNTNLGLGNVVLLTTPSGAQAVATVDLISGGVTYVGFVENISQAIAGCTVSRPITTGGACEPPSILPAGTLITLDQTGPIRNSAALFAGGQGPYPFWQFVPNPSTAAGQTSGEVFSDNHGEAIVSLQTGIQDQVVPTGLGTSSVSCPAGYQLTPNGQNCLLNIANLGAASTSPNGTAFGNITAANTAFSGSKPGCVQTTATGTSSIVPAATAVPASTSAAPAQTAINPATSATSSSATSSPVVGGTGPTPGQICINALGGIELGSGATLGSTTIQAIADYPYNRGLHAPISSGAIQKVFTSAFNKSLTVSAGTAGPNGTTSYTVTITATDLCGAAIVGEPVNVFALSGASGAVVLAPLGNGTPNGASAATVTLNAQGTATLSLEVLNSALGNQGLVLKAVFPFEGVERFATVVSGTASQTTATVLYTPGYNMVGGPSGSNFGAAEALFSYDPTAGTYGNATSSETSISSAAPACTGYYAYFASATAVSLPVTSTSGDTAACSLKAGFNLVGNPFATPALLPSGTIAYHYNGTTYDVVSAIPVGGAVFIFESAATTLTLTAS